MSLDDGVLAHLGATHRVATSAPAATLGPDAVRGPLAESTPTPGDWQDDLKVAYSPSRLTGRARACPVRELTDSEPRRGVQADHELVSV